MVEVLITRKELELKYSSVSDKEVNEILQLVRNKTNNSIYISEMFYEVGWFKKKQIGYYSIMQDTNMGVRQVPLKSDTSENKSEVIAYLSGVIDAVDIIEKNLGYKFLK